MDLWLKEYNEAGPHQSLEYLTPEGRLRCAAHPETD
ncbi:MAG: hypothetical protein JO121_13295 [Deltaproteobacteria bacterium]|nr:hypothetical protein [Deltaproteobacteria bacterium]